MRKVTRNVAKKRSTVIQYPAMDTQSSLKGRGNWSHTTHAAHSTHTECHSENEVKPRDPIRCQECGCRIMYKKRTQWRSPPVQVAG